MTIDISFLLAAGFLFCLAAVLLYGAERLRRRTAVPDGRVLYRDTWRQTKTARPLFSPELGLVGRPDYLVRLPNGAIVPVEVKTSRAPREPYEGHLMQLVAYCALVAETTGQRPPFGILRYADHSFEIDYTAELEEALIDLLAYMGEDLYAPDVPRSHREIGRCASCGVRNYCTARLA